MDEIMMFSGKKPDTKDYILYYSILLFHCNFISENKNKLSI